MKPSDMRLIDKYLAEFTFNEVHGVDIKANLEAVYQSAKDVDLSRSKLITILFKLRGLPTRRMNLQGFISDMGFTNLEERFPVENLIGFWMKTKIEPVPGFEAFIGNTISPRIKVAWNFHCEKIGSGTTRLSTETRILCMTKASRLIFGMYWFFIKPFSGLVRQEMLKIIKADAESTTNPPR